MYKGGCDTCWSIHFEVFKRKEELAWAKDKWLWVISNLYNVIKTVTRSTTKELKNKAI